MRKSQAALEYAFLLGVVMLIVVVTAMVAIRIVQEGVKLVEKEVDAILEELGNECS